MPELLAAAVLGACGGVLYELVELARFLKVRGHFPWSPRRRPRVVRVDGVLRRYETFPVFATAVAIRVVVGAAVAAALTLAGAVNLLGALVAGVAGYTIIDRWADGAQVHDGRSATTAGRSEP
jgi:hypothetical protein